MVPVVGDPNEHLLASGKDGAADKQGTEFNGMVPPITGLDYLLSEIPDEQWVHLLVDEHVERDLIPRLIFIEINVTGIIYRTEYVLHTGGDIIPALFCLSLISALIEIHVLLKGITTFIYIPFEMIGPQTPGINVRLVSIPHLEDPVVPWI